MDSTHLDNMMEGLRGLQKDAKSLLNQISDPDLLKHLDDDQKELVRDAKKAVNLKGLTPQQMHDKLQGIVDKHGLNKNHGA